MGEFYESVIFTKIICMLVLGIGSLISGCLPLMLTYFYKRKTYNNETEKINSEYKRRRIISLLMSFTGGVLFCTVFIHLLPEVGEIFEQLKQNDKYKNLPEFLPQALLCFGFFMMYFIEEFAHKLIHSEKNNKNDEGSVTTRCDSLSFAENRANSSISEDKKDIFIKNVLNITEDASKKFSFQERQYIINVIIKSMDMYSMNKYCVHSSDADTCTPIRDQSMNDLHEVELIKHSERTSVRSFLLALALSVHALFEGMAIGLEKESSSVWLMLFGVGSHKIVLSACMGIEMVAGNTRALIHILYVLVFSIVSPIGALLGLYVSNEEETASALCQGIASGTLLYVLFFEVLKTNNDDECDVDNKNSGFTSFFVILLGFLLMALLQVFAEYDQ